MHQQIQNKTVHRRRDYLTVLTHTSCNIPVINACIYERCYVCKILRICNNFKFLLIASHVDILRKGILDLYVFTTHTVIRIQRGKRCTRHCMYLPGRNLSYMLLHNAGCICLLLYVYVIIY